MKKAEVTLVPLKEFDREQFILDNQWAFKHGALLEFGERDGHIDSDGEIISQESNSVNISRLTELFLKEKTPAESFFRSTKRRTATNLIFCLFFRNFTAKESVTEPGWPRKNCIRKQRSGKPAPHISIKETFIFT